jgi:NADP-dependent 3-hydroxy acid dehydrogenase YdfG
MTDTSLTSPPDLTGQDLTGQTALITGASSGLGARFARVLAAAGARTVIAARRMDRLNELKTDIEAAGGEVLPVYSTSMTSTILRRFTTSWRRPAICPIFWSIMPA